MIAVIYTGLGAAADNNDGDDGDDDNGDQLGNYPN